MINPHISIRKMVQPSRSSDRSWLIIRSHITWTFKTEVIQTLLAMVEALGCVKLLKTLIAFISTIIVILIKRNFSFVFALTIFIELFFPRSCWSLIYYFFSSHLIYIPNLKYKWTFWRVLEIIITWWTKRTFDIEE